MKKTMYRISLLPNHNLLCQELAIEAARSNGGSELISIPYLENYFNHETKKYPVSNMDMTFEVIGDNLIHVDRKVGDKYETVLIIEQVDIMEVPTLSAYENTGGILNPDLHECIN